MKSEPPAHLKSPNRQQLQALITAVGGAERMHEIIFKFYVRMSNDVMIGFFFAGKNLEEVAKQQTHFILNAAGLIDRFEGKGPSTAHVALPPILRGHFDRRLVLLRETLTAAELDPLLINEWIQFEEGFRSIVVS